MLMSSNERRTSTILNRASGVSLAAALLLSATFPGCEKHREGDGHDHGAKDVATTKPHGEDDAHDHAAESSEHADEVTLTQEAIERYCLKVEPAQLWVLRPTFVAPARVAFNTEAMAHVGSPLPGRAVEIKVRRGDHVKVGQALVVVESPELGEAQNAYFQNRVAAQSAAPAVELAKVAWERAKGLYEKSEGISLNEVQKREAEYKAAVAAQKTAEAAVIGAENRLHLLGMSQDAVGALADSGEVAPRYTIVAPIDGQVVQRELTQGELVGPDREALLVIADTRTLWVLADVPEAHLPELSTGAKAWITIGTVEGRKYEGLVAFISPEVDPTTRTAQVRIEVPASELALKPGMFAQAEIAATLADGQEPAPIVAVPTDAVQTVEGMTSVFVPVEGEPNTFQRRSISAGKAVGSLVPVLSGVVEGERVVVAGSFILKAELGKGSAAHEH